MADRCLQRPDCTSVTIRREQDFVYVRACTILHHHSYHQNPSPLSLYCKTHVLNAPLCCGKNTGLPCQSPLPPTLSRWPGSISTGAQAQWVLCGLPLPSIPLISTCFSVNWIPDCISFTVTRFLSTPCSSGPCSSYWQAGAERVKAVILENGVRRGKMCMMFSRERDSEFPVHIIALWRILVPLRCRT